MENGTYFKVKYANNVSTRLAKKLDFLDTTCEVLPLDDKKTTWPDLSTPNSFFMCVLAAADNTYEVVKCTKYVVDGTTGNVILSIERGQEGTIPQTFQAGTLIENRVTAAILNERLNYIVEGVIPGPPGEKGDRGEKGDPGVQGPKGDPGDGFPDIATPTTVGLSKPDNKTIIVDNNGVYSVKNTSISIYATIPSEKQDDIIFVANANTIMYWDVDLSIYRSTRPVEMSFSMYGESKLPFGTYHADGRSIGLTTAMGKVLNSLPEDTKRDWNIVVSTEHSTITMPSLYAIDKRGCFVRPGTVPGITQSDAMRNATGTFYSAGQYGLFDTKSTGVFKSVDIVPVTTIAYTEGTSAHGVSFDLSGSVPTADEVRVLNKTMLPVIYLGV